MNDEIDDAALLAFLDKVDPIPVSPIPSLGVSGGNVQKCMVPNDGSNEVDDAALMEFLDRVDPIPFSPSASINTLNENSRTAAALPSSHLSRTLNQHFGFTSFRPGQETAVSDILRGRDVGVFWSTGSGKSLCYLLPALESGQISIVISPLISLMQDQCIAFNNTVGKGRTLAVYLGSSQTDPDIEQAAFQGTYLVIFMTPEKLESSRRSLEVLHASRRIGLLAVDEAHCCSQWGHDFRPPYQRIGENFRSVPSLSKVPIMALTATATPRIRIDIMRSLAMSPTSTTVLSNSFDRKNLALRVLALRAGGFFHNLAFLSDAFRLGDKGSTIVYVATTKNVDAISDYLSSDLQPYGGIVMPYHAKLTHGQRETAHRAFLTGQCHVIVATVAFGMGIDKPDIRRVINYGAPKCLEDYYQQIGRGGRDGRSTVCTLIHSEQELTNFTSDFYTSGKDSSTKSQHLEGVEKMRTYANSSECRRVLLMKHFMETPTFSSCTNCDNCEAKSSSTEFLRDFTFECKFILGVISSSSSGIGKMIDAAIEKVKKEGAKFPQHSKFTSRPKTFLKAFYEEIVKKLHGEGYIDARIESITVGGGNRSYTTYNLTAKARQVLSSPSSTICLPVPEKLREEERQEERRRAAEVKELKDCGIDTAFLAQEDENVAETSLQDSLNWIRMLKRYRESGREAMADAKEELLDRIMQWRQRTAVELSMAPEGLLKKSLALRIAYSQAATVESLEAVGLRVNGVDRLAAILSESVVELGLRQDGRISLGADDSASLISDNDIMVFASGPIRIDSSKMKSAATSAGKITAAPAWKVSYEKFAAGSSIETIAMSNTKAILVATVIGHLTEAYLNGCAVDWNRLSAEASRAAVPFPTKVICAKLETAAALLGMDPATSELNATVVLQVEKHCIRSKSVLNQTLTKDLITIKEYTGSAGCIFT